LNIYNLGNEDVINVDRIAEIICKKLNLKGVKFNYSGGKRGWVGDSPFILLDIKKMKSLGWKPSLGIEQCVVKTLEWIKDNEWVLERN